jgi:hypothetical protein
MSKLNNDEEYLGWFIDWREDYSQFFRKDSWYTFTFIQIEFESDVIMGGLEATLMVLGLGFRIRYNYKETEQYKDIKEMIDHL